MELKTNYNSTTNQEIKSKFVQREVLTCFSYEMEAVLNAEVEQIGSNKELPDREDIENFYIPMSEFKDYGYESAQEFVESGEDVHEILEWWIITDYLYRKLKEKGQPVLEWGNNYYWGRCTTGQAILLDHVISEICEDIQILEGQKYSWA